MGGVKAAVTILLTLGLGLAGCGGGASGSDPPRREATGFHDSLLGIGARVPAGWSARGARFGARQLRLDLIASSSRIPTPPGSSLTPSSHLSPCRSNGGAPPPGEVGVLLYEHPGLDGAGLARHETWFSSRPERFLDSLSFSVPRPDPIGEAALSIHLGGRQLQLAAGLGSIWALSCDRGCGAKSRPSGGRVVRIDPGSGRVIASARLHGASDLAVGPAGVYVTDFWGDTVRRLDPRRLRVTARLGLKLPFEIVPGDRSFLPYDAAVTASALWVSTARGVLARIDPDLSQVVGVVRLPFDATGEVAAESGAVWTAEQLAGVYRVDPAARRVIARIRVGPRGRRLAIQDVVLGGGEVFAVGARIGRHQVPTGGYALARIDPATDRVQAVTSLPRGAGIRFAYGAGALWVARFDGPGVYRIDPETGQVTDRVAADAGAGLLVADGWLWTASPGGTIRRTAANRSPSDRPGPTL